MTARGLEPQRTHRLRGNPSPDVARIARLLLDAGAHQIAHPLDAGEARTRLLQGKGEATAFRYWPGVCYVQAIEARAQHVNSAAGQAIKPNTLYYLPLSAHDEQMLADCQAEHEIAARFLSVARALEDVLRVDAQG